VRLEGDLPCGGVVGMTEIELEQAHKLARSIAKRQGALPRDAVRNSSAPSLQLPGSSSETGSAAAPRWEPLRAPEVAPPRILKVVVELRSKASLRLRRCHLTKLRGRELTHLLACGRTQSTMGRFDLAEMGFEGVEPAATGRPSYHPSVLH
jgi:hypothetical protein